MKNEYPDGINQFGAWVKDAVKKSTLHLIVKDLILEFQILLAAFNLAKYLTIPLILRQVVIHQVSIHCIYTF